LNVVMAGLVPAMTIPGALLYRSGCTGIGERSDAVIRMAIGERSDAVLRTAIGERSDAVLRTAMARG
jgi:hypothetical protein